MNHEAAIWQEETCSVIFLDLKKGKDVGRSKNTTLQKILIFLFFYFWYSEFKKITSVITK